MSENTGEPTTNVEEPVEEEPVEEEPVEEEPVEEEPVEEEPVEKEPEVANTEEVPVMVKVTFELDGGKVVYGDEIKLKAISAQYGSEDLSFLFTEIKYVGNTDAGYHGLKVGAGGTVKVTLDEEAAKGYQITYEEGVLEIGRKPITVTIKADAQTVTYGDTVTLTSDAPEGVFESIKFKVKEVKAAEYVLVDKNGVVNREAVDISLVNNAPNYAISYAPSTLKVDAKPIEVMIKADAEKVTYGDTVTLTSDAPEGVIDSLEYKDGTDAGDYTLATNGSVNAEAVTVTLGEEADNYAITYKDSTLTIEPLVVNATVTIEKTYDGTNAIDKDTDAEITTGCDNEKVSIAVTPGDDTNSVTAKLGEADEIELGTFTGKENVSDDDPEVITVEDGNYAGSTVTITETVNPLVVEATVTITKTYDGTAAIDEDNTDAEVKVECNNDEVSVAVTPGDDTNSVTAQIVNADEIELGTFTGKVNVDDDDPAKIEVKEGNYAGSTVTITETVNPLAVKATVTITKTYDGTNAIDKDTDAEIETGCDNEKVTIAVTPGDDTNSVTAKLGEADEIELGTFTGKENVSDDDPEVITVEDGNYAGSTVTITETVNPLVVEVTVTITKTYDGTATIDEDNTDAEVKVECNNDEVSVAVTPGDDTNSVTAQIVNADEIELGTFTGKVNADDADPAKIEVKDGNYAGSTVTITETVNPLKIAMKSFVQVQGDKPYTFMVTFDTAPISGDGFVLDFDCFTGDEDPVVSADGSEKLTISLDGTYVDAEEWNGKAVSVDVSEAPYDGETIHGNYSIDPASASYEPVDFINEGASIEYSNRSTTMSLTTDDSILDGNQSVTIQGYSATLSSKDKSVTGFDGWVSGGNLIHTGTTISFEYKDAFGNTGTASGTASKDTITTPVKGKLYNKVLNEKSKSVTVKYSAANYEPVRIRVDGPDGYSKSVTIGGEGAYAAVDATHNPNSFDMGVVDLAMPNIDGDYTITIEYTDVNGKAWTTAFTVDTVVNDTAVMMKPFVYGDYVVLSGVTEPGSRISVAANGQYAVTTEDVVADAAGHFQVIAPMQNVKDNELLKGEVDEKNIFNVTITDPAGNKSKFDVVPTSWENYDAHLVTVGKWVVRAGEQPSDWATVTPITVEDRAAMEVPLLLGGLYEVGAVTVNGSGSSMTVSYTLDESILDPEGTTLVGASFTVYDFIPTIEQLNGEEALPEDGHAVALQSGAAISLGDIAEDAVLYLAADVNVTIADLDEVTGDIITEPYDFANSVIYKNANR